MWLAREPKQFLQEHYRKLLVVAALPILVVLVSSQMFNPSLLLSQCSHCPVPMMNHNFLFVQSCVTILISMHTVKLQVKNSYLGVDDNK